jgi:hypothetical protein
VSKKKALGQDPFSKEIFPWIKSTGDENQTKAVHTHTAATATAERTVKPSIQSTPSKQSLQGKHDETIRQTYHLSNDNVEKIKKYAYIERLKISEVVNKALAEFFEDKKFSA